MYTLGIDLGTTFTAAATWRDGHVEIASLGSRAAVIPSVVLLREDETVLTGETAHRRGLSEPHRVSREFKRRLGDTTPILLGGAPYSAEALMGRLLRSVVDDVTLREGGPPAKFCISHPANWGPYKKDLLAQAVRLSNLDLPVSYTTEPEAAAVFYAHQQRVEAGAVVAVYDLGGGTFDAAVLQKTATGFEILGQPEGIERLGGIDFDAAVFSHVGRALGGKLAELDEDDPAAIAAVARLREECVQAKEVLSSDTDASIPVLLPNVSTEIRLTRGELETMIRPTLHSTIEALRRALRSAGVAPEQLHSVLLVGGSSRMPLVAQLVGAELGRPVAVDAHPKHAVALGAAWLASGAGTPAAPAAVGGLAGPLGTGDPRPTYTGTATVPMAAAGGAAAAGAASSTGPAAGAPAARSPGFTASPGFAATPGYPAIPNPAATGGYPATPTRGMPATSGMGAVPGAARGTSAPSGPPTRGTARPAAASGPPPFSSVGAAGAGSPVRPSGPPAPPARPPDRQRRRVLLVGAAALAILLAGGAVAWAVTNRDPGTDPVGRETDEPTGGPTQGPSEPSTPPDEQCTAEIQSNQRWACLTSATLDGGQLVIDYQAEWAGGVPDVSNGFHLHIYGGDGTTPPDHIMGSQAGAEAGDWVIKDALPAVLNPQEVAEVIGDAPKVCARIADTSHALVPDASGGFNTGNCTPIRR
jgi:actin-like ATPase involved in cell morphogenesis